MRHRACLRHPACNLRAFCLAVVLATTAPAAADVCATVRSGSFVQRSARIDAVTVRYTVFVPAPAAGVTPSILLYLHGASGIGTDGSNPRFPAIVVFPQARERWVTPAMERIALTTLDRAAHEFHAADERNHAFLRAPDPYAALAAHLDAVHVAVYHGARDTVVPPAESRRIVAALRFRRSDVRFTEYAWADHRTVLSGVVSDRTLFPRLLAQHRFPAHTARAAASCAGVVASVPGR